MTMVRVILMWQCSRLEIIRSKILQGWKDFCNSAMTIVPIMCTTTMEKDDNLLAHQIEAVRF